MKRFTLYAIGLILVAFLTLGVYTGVRLVTSGKVSGLPRGLGPSMTTLQKAPELPVEDPELVGIFLRREDNVLFVGTGNVKFHFVRENDSDPFRMEKSYDGPVIEVVVTHDTAIYFDVTSIHQEPDPETGKVNQVLEVGTLDDLGMDHLFQVWGERQGDRVVAKTLLVFSPPS